MEWVIALWNKLNKPLHFLLVGMVLAIFAPEPIKLAGFASIAFGIAGVIEWTARKIGQRIDRHKNVNRLKALISTLNTDERAVLEEQAQKGEQTFYLDWHHFHGINAQFEEDEYRRLEGVCLGLVHKRFLTATSYDAIAVFHIEDAVWRLLQTDRKKGEV